jgi:hypothetical protein
MENKVTDDDITMIQYFFYDKGDITRWSQWEERKPIIAKEYPEIIQAMDNLNIAERTLRAVINQLSE